MTSPLDPYRVLGLPAGASLSEIKGAYRRLAKAYHPDSAGVEATPRFLAIQEAYDALTDARRDGAPFRPARSGGGTHGANGSARAGARSWRRPPGASPEPGPAPFGRRRAGAGSAGGGSTPSGEGGWWQHRTRRPPNRATLGSTTYDDAGESEPEWEGAGWYGQTTGTYWTINPREYADPRKHGPEYQARARRMLEDEAADLAGGGEPVVGGIGGFGEEAEAATGGIGGFATEE